MAHPGPHADAFRRSPKLEIARQFLEAEADMSSGVCELVLGYARSSFMYMVGGTNEYGNTIDSVEKYDPTLDEWTAVAVMSTKRYGHDVAVLDGMLYVIGGQTKHDNCYNHLASVEKYDPARDTWTAVASMGTKRYGLGVAVLDGMLYAVGGFDEHDNKFASVEKYNPATNTWLAVAAMGTKRFNLGVAVLDGALYAVGGFDEHYNRLASVEKYDPATNKWMEVAAMGTPRCTLGVTAMDDALYAVGGYNHDGEISSVEKYDPATNTWLAVTSMGTKRYGHVVAS